MEIVEKHGAMTVEQLAMQRGRGVSSTHQHVRILADLGYLEESPYTIVPDPLRPSRVLRLARTYTTTDVARLMLAKHAQPDAARVEAREDVRDTLTRTHGTKVTFPGLSIPEIAADTGRSHDEIKVALDDLGAREEVATRTWRLP